MAELLRRWLHEDVGVRRPLDSLEKVRADASMPSLPTRASDNFGSERRRR
jgi:hypothetical protein|tara:strand:+ start:271 stop:420 length:150 start_codon:yes stop_codon:yes gene_type:complete